LKSGEHSKYLPFVFSEQVVALRVSVLKIETAIQVNKTYEFLELL